MISGNTVWVTDIGPTSWKFEYINNYGSVHKWVRDGDVYLLKFLSTSHRKSHIIFSFFIIRVWILASTSKSCALLVCHVVWVIAFVAGSELIEFRRRYWVSKLAQHQWLIRYELTENNNKKLSPKKQFVPIVLLALTASCFMGDSRQRNAKYVRHVRQWLSSLLCALVLLKLPPLLCSSSLLAPPSLHPVTNWNDNNHC